MTEKHKSSLQVATERLYGKPIADVVEELYTKYGNFDDVAREVGTVRQTLYNWVGGNRMTAIRARYLARQSDDAESRARAG